MDTIPGRTIGRQSPGGYPGRNIRFFRFGTVGPGMSDMHACGDHEGGFAVFLDWLLCVKVDWIEAEEVKGTKAPCG